MLQAVPLPSENDIRQTQILMRALIGQQYFIVNEVPCCLSDSSRPAGSSVCEWVCKGAQKRKKQLGFFFFIAGWKKKKKMQYRLMWNDSSTLAIPHHLLLSWTCCNNSYQTQVCFVEKHGWKQRLCAIWMRRSLRDRGGELGLYSISKIFPDVFKSSVI